MEVEGPEQQGGEKTSFPKPAQNISDERRSKQGQELGHGGVNQQFLISGTIGCISSGFL